MRTFARQSWLVLVLVALAILLAQPGGALAAGPGFHDRFTEAIPDTNICGVDGSSVVKVNQLGTFTDTSFEITGQFTEIFTADDGRTATLHVAGPATGTFTDNGDGTGTVVDTFKGLPEQIRGGGGGVETFDAGLISFVTTFDLETGEVISDSVVVHGPHPEADADFELFCDAFLAALG